MFKTWACGVKAGLLGVVCLLQACATSPSPQEPVQLPTKPDIPQTLPPVVEPAAPLQEPILEQPPEEAPQDTTPEPIYNDISRFEALSHWQSTDMRAGLAAFQKACALWDKRAPTEYLHKTRQEYGQYRDWQSACFAADYVAADIAAARQFFETYFDPVNLMTASGGEGLLTGYYEPLMQVRRAQSPEFSEPLLGLPYNKANTKLPRSKINPSLAPVMAYGRPIDVFFTQIQGSSRIVFEDGHQLRAAFAAHNGQPYTSIGKVLVDRGEMSLDEASKQSIERWMQDNGPAKAQALMNENARYVFFKSEVISGDEGPKGAMGIPLEAMGTMAIDPAYHPYGPPVFLQTTLPQNSGDYIGAPSGALVSLQDTGGAIKGALRGDLFFGSGDEAGGRAGVMKHKVRWTLLLPAPLAIRFLGIS